MRGKKKSQPSNIRNKERQQEISVNMQMCRGWTRRNFWLLPNEVSANTVCMPTSPFSSSKLFSEALHTNGEELESLSFEKCCAALNIRYKPLRSAKQDTIYCMTAPPEIRGLGKGAGTFLGLPCTKLTNSLLPSPDSKLGDTRLRNIGFAHLCFVFLLQCLLPHSKLPWWKSLNKYNH